MELINGDYRVDGINLLDLVEKYKAPLFVYDGNRIATQVRTFREALNLPSLRINYACKALTNVSILKLMRSLGTGLDTVSYQEIRLGLIAGFTPQEILYTPNMVSIEEIEAAIQLGVQINIDNIETLEYLGHHHSGLALCIRINPHVMAGGNSKISVGHIDSKFGISIHQLPLVKRIVESLEMNIKGIHMHTGSDILDTEVFMRAAEILFDSALHFKDLDYIDFGSGFKVKYKADDIETDIEEFGKLMSKRFKSFCQEYGKELSLVFEPGKFLVSESGYFLTRANVVKQTTSTMFVGLDSGFNHLIRPMFYDAYHEIMNISNPEGRPRIYTVTGYICETDTFGWNRKINEVKAGDILAFKNAGAYCYQMSSNYNSRYRPPEVLIYKSKEHLIRRREVLADLTNMQVDVITF